MSWKDAIKSINSRIKKSFTDVKSEMDDHRESINANSNEIQNLYEYLLKLEAKVDKLTERIDEFSCADQKYTIPEATTNEKEVFLALYTSDHQETAIKDIARRAGRTIEQAEILLSNLMQKGIPIKQIISQDGKTFSIDPDFKAFQTKHNVMQINSVIAQNVK